MLKILWIPNNMDDLLPSGKNIALGESLFMRVKIITI
jgi:hypothetical protein